MTKHITPEEYLELDRKAEFKSEYWTGELTPIGDPDWVHSIITANVIDELSRHLHDRGDAVCISDARIPACDSVLFPDAAVVCGPLRSPTVIVEVSTAATAVADGGRKFGCYGSVSSVQEYVWIAADRVDARVFTRRLQREWLMALRHDLDDTLTLPTLNLHLRLADIYRKVEFSDAEVGVGYMRPLQS